MDRKKERKLIQASLLAQLDEKGLNQEHYKSLVDDYLRMWDTKNALFDDVEKRGVSIEWNNGGGQNGWKKNDSVSEVNRISSGMLKILSELGLRGANIKDAEGYEDM